ncbi:tetratricopeptide repeat protein [Streptomyces tanashiensis]
MDLLWASLDLAESGANSREYEAVAAVVREAAHAAGDVRAEGRAALTLAYVQHVAGRFDEADGHAHESMDLASTTGDDLPLCWAANALGIMALYQGRNADGERFLTQATESFRACDDAAGEASALCNLSRIHLAMGQTDIAVELAQRGTAMYDTMGHALKGANGRYALGLALTQSGQLVEAAGRLAEALEVFQDSRQRLWEGMSLFRIAEVDIAARRFAQAASNSETALVILRGVGGEWRRGQVLVVLGRALSGIGQHGRARVCWQEALDIFVELGSPEESQVRTLLLETAAA